MTNSSTLSGIQALVLSAIENEVHAVFGVPGSPITAVMNAFMDSAELKSSSSWFANEKTAFEWGLGSSFAKKRSLVLVKHVGMNVLADPLMTSMVHNIGAGLVILAGDDPEVSGSQNSQDTRYFGLLSGTAVFDPATPQDIYNDIGKAFALSEKIKAPVIIRVTAFVLNDKQIVSRFPQKNPADDSYTRTSWDFKMKGRYQRFHMLNDSLIQKKAEECCKIISKNEGSDSDSNLDSNSVGIITSGGCSSRTKTALDSFSKLDYSLLKLGMPAPLPISSIRSFLKSHSKVLVVEESEPFIEDQIRVFGNVFGKRSGHLPFGYVAEADIVYALENLSSPSVSKSAELLKRSPETPLYFCQDCIYVPFYDMMAAFKKEQNVPITGDIGCSMYGAVMPYDVLDTALSLGAGIGIGSGVSRARRQKSVVVIGDFGFFHSGLLSLIEAVSKNVPLLIFVMKNTMAAMTGGQPISAPENIIQAVLSEKDGVKNSYHFISLDIENVQVEMEKIKMLAADELKKEGVSVIVLSWDCKKYKK